VQKRELSSSVFLHHFPKQFCRLTHAFFSPFITSPQATVRLSFQEVQQARKQASQPAGMKFEERQTNKSK
jgi:hypothetical protein